MTTFRLRPANSGDRLFLTDMLIEAINWTPGRDVTREAVAADPALAHYVEGWMRDTDFGVIAEDGDGTPAGACWVRYFTSADPSYGYIADDVPELTISVVADWRGRGAGRAMIREALAEARRRGIARVCLSVERGNDGPAKLYYSEDFRFHSAGDGADNLVRDLA